MKYIILTRLGYYLIFRDVQRIQLGIQLWLYFCENFHKKSEFDTVWLIFGGISHVSKIITYKIWRSWSKCFQDFSLSITKECCLLHLFHSAKRKYKNEIVFSNHGFYFVGSASSKSSCFLVLCGKAVVRLALVHSKYIGHGKIAKIRAQRRVKFF